MYLGNKNILLIITSRVNWPLTRKAGMLQETASGIRYLMVKLLSVRTMSPGWKWFGIPLSQMIALSEVLPPYRLLIKVIAPLGTN